MDLADFDSFPIGYGLSVEEKAAIEVEMAKRRLEENLASISFWGRITGTTGDYLIVCGLTSVMDAPHKKFYYATNKNLTLQQLPDLSDEFQKIAAELSGRFHGNPTKLLGPDADAEEEEEEQEEEGGQAKPRKLRFSESHRLAYAVSQIESDCGVVPRGAFSVTATHHIVADKLFCGVAPTNATDLSHYYHFRGSSHPARRYALSKAMVIGAGDWLDPISQDEPKGVWRAHLDTGRNQVTLRSLRWPGYFFFHNISSPKFGGAYFGDGLEAKDLCFMMPPVDE